MNRIYHPRSFVSLLLTGFIFVALPLVVALGSAIQILDGLVQQSAVAVFRSAGRVDNCRKVAELLNREERSARLFLVLGETEHLEDVTARHREIEELLGQFAGLNPGSELIGLLEQLQNKERLLIEKLTDLSGTATDRKSRQEKAVTGYSEIGSLVEELERSSNGLMIKEVDALKERVQSNKNALTWQISGLIGFSVLLVVLFMSLINKPVSQLDRGIERLGEGDFSTPIVVSGPRDLETIGEKLDWLRKRLNTLDREKVRMLAHISHELKTPLSSIKEGAGLLKDGLVGSLSDQQIEVVGILDNNCSKLQKLIQNILDFNMAQAKEVPLDFQDVRIDALVADVTEDHRNAMLARNIHLKTELLPVQVNGNPQQLKTVLDNLLANAVKFTPDDGEIGIIMRRKGQMLRLLVEDSGPGISEEDRAQIFLPFFQGQQKNRSVMKGSGLGLAISKEYIQNSGGTLRLLPSEQGACFEVVMPCSRDEAP
ncbi:HAMP domain-containing sensor histidine kinase [Desulfobulbus sp.]|uniref:HAMP domain-containing sensor histidine kinase n=1 Tax=Desulfobulbus sp. TaxID=895 RepID=UPI00286F12C3|nr:HAMP domain-containing sensor histidine kinase [Desulfobulbus sp.]